MGKRVEMMNGFYDGYKEDDRLERSRRGQLEFFTTMEYIHRYVGKDARILETGAGTGKYSLTLAKEGMDVTAVELVEKNLEILRRNSEGIPNIHSYQGDATDLSRFPDGCFDAVLVFGPMYHLFEPAEIDQAIDEAIRVCRKGGVLFFAFLSVYAIMYANYLSGNWAAGEEENFTEDHSVRHFEEQLFTGYDISEFEELFTEKAVEPLAIVSTDGFLEAIQKQPGFCFSDEDFEAFKKWHLAFAEKRELLGLTSHLLYICRRKQP